jgi:hypothetical protein
MILTAPSLTGSSKDDGAEKPGGKDLIPPYYSSSVIKKFVNHTSLTASPVYSEFNGTSPLADVRRIHVAASVYITKATIASNAKATVASNTKATVASNTKATISSISKVSVASHITVSSATISAAAKVSVASATRARELKMVINQAVLLYNYMDLENDGLNEQAFEYAWRGYHNLLKKGLIRKKSVLTICDFSQPSYSQRMYVIDVRHKKLLYRTFVAHGQNSGEDYATSFSNDPDSYKSSLGFYITKRTYSGRNGLSLRISGVDTGYNDKAAKRNIVLHGSSYVNPQYVSDFGTIGTSQGCPAMPTGISPKIIRTVKNGSCFFIYHPTQEYLQGSVVINGY